MQDYQRFQTAIAEIFGKGTKKNLFMQLFACIFRLTYKNKFERYEKNIGFIGNSMSYSGLCYNEEQELEEQQ